MAINTPSGPGKDPNKIEGVEFVVDSATDSTSAAEGREERRAEVRKEGREGLRVQKQRFQNKRSR